MAHIWRIFGAQVAGIWRVFGGYLAGSWRVFGGQVAGSWAGVWAGTWAGIWARIWRVFCVYLAPTVAPIVAASRAASQTPLVLGCLHCYLGTHLPDGGAVLRLRQVMLRVAVANAFCGEVLGRVIKPMHGVVRFCIDRLPPFDFRIHVFFHTQTLFETYYKSYRILHPKRIGNVFCKIYIILKLA